MRLRNAGYYFRRAVLSLVRNGWMSTASVVSVMVCLLILGSSLLAVAHIGQLASHFESGVEAVVWVDVGTPRDEVLALAEKLRNIPGVSAVELVPKEEGLAQLAGKFSNPQELLSALGGVNPLPDYFRVSAADPHEIPRIAHEASTFQHVERVVYGREVVEKLFALLKWIRWIGWGAIGFLSLAAVAIVGMTVRLNVLSRRKEISVMRYVGATSWFVRWPFILEGMILGFLGAALAVALLGPVYIWLLDGVNRALQFLPLAASPDLLWGVAGILVVAGVLIGGVGSVVSVHRFLKV